MTAPRLAQARYPLLGILAVSLALVCVGLTFAVYNKAFSKTESVTVIIERAEEQLDVHADVKLRGVRVGEVRRLTPTSDGKIALEVALDRDRVGQVPADVKARILPKTLFGEKFVDLVTAATASNGIVAGAVIYQDTSARSVALQEVFDDLYPLLKTVRPADLNKTLSSMATALAGRGAQLGGTIDRLASYSSALRTLLPDLQSDLALLAEVSQRYGDAAPALVSIARSTSVTAQTVHERSKALEAVLQDTYSLSSRVETLLAENEERIVSLAATARPTLELLARYSPEYGCVFNGAKLAIQRIYDVFGGDDGPFVIRGRLRIGQTRGAYPQSLAPNGKLQRELLEDLAAYGPSCPRVNTNPVGGTPNAEIPIPALALTGKYRGLLGVPATPLDTRTQQEQEIAESQLPGLGLPTLGDPSGSPLDQAAVQDAAEALTGGKPGPSNSVLNLLLGPLVRGMTVGGAK